MADEIRVESGRRVVQKQQQDFFRFNRISTIIGHHHKVPAFSPFRDDVCSEDEPRVSPLRHCTTNDKAREC